MISAVGHSWPTPRAGESQRGRLKEISGASGKTLASPRLCAEALSGIMNPNLGLKIYAGILAAEAFHTHTGDPGPRPRITQTHNVSNRSLTTAENAVSLLVRCARRPSDVRLIIENVNAGICTRIQVLCGNLFI